MFIKSQRLSKLIWSAMPIHLSEISIQFNIQINLVVHNELLEVWTVKSCHPECYQHISIFILFQVSLLLSSQQTPAAFQPAQASLNDKQTVQVVRVCQIIQLKQTSSNTENLWKNECVLICFIMDFFLIAIRYVSSSETRDLLIQTCEVSYLTNWSQFALER